MDDISAQLGNYTMEENICERHFLDNVSQNSQVYSQASGQRTNVK